MGRHEIEECPFCGERFKRRFWSESRNKIIKRVICPHCLRDLYGIENGSITPFDTSLIEEEGHTLFEEVFLPIRDVVEAIFDSIKYLPDMFGGMISDGGVVARENAEELISPPIYNINYDDRLVRRKRGGLHISWIELECSNCGTEFSFYSHSGDHEGFLLSEAISEMRGKGWLVDVPGSGKIICPDCYSPPCPLDLEQDPLIMGGTR